jgi:excisionase family DNA binding protein
MNEYLTTREVARLLRLNEKKIYALVTQGGLPAARVSGKWLFPRELVEAWVRGHTLIPEEQALGALLGRVIVLQGSDDWLLDHALTSLQPDSEAALTSARIGSRQGLEALDRGRAHAAAFHLEAGEAVRSLGRGQRYLVDLYDREQGLVLAERLAGQVSDLQAVAARGLRFALRQPGSGTHRLTERLLEEAGTSLAALPRVGPFGSHLEVALAVRVDRADTGLCIRAAAEACGLPFVPLRLERFRLCVPAAFFGAAPFARFLEQLLGWLRARPDEETRGYDLTSLGRLTPQSS